MALLTIRVLGTPEITVGGQPLSFRTRKMLALLVYLVVEGGMHSRESLMALLWPESSAKDGAVTLRGTLSRLRQALQPAGTVLFTAEGKIGFDLSTIAEMDLTWLSKAVLPETIPTDLENILEVDRGEFLDGFSLPDAPEFDHWAAIQREFYQRQVEAIYDRLTQHQLAYHESAVAVETAARWVSRALLSEVAYRRLMAAQALTGDRPGALRTYQQCQVILQAEFGIEPGRETTTLAESIAQDRLPESPRPKFTKHRQTLIGHPAAIQPGKISPPLPFAGRAEEHSQLVAEFRQASQTSARAATLIGIAGVGKTRLVNAFHEWLELDSPGVEIWQGRAFEAGGSLPFQPVIEALRMRLEQENAPEDLLEDIWLAELSQLMPELRARYPDLPPPMTGDASFIRSRLFEAVAILGSALTVRHPAVFILDDMQWANTDTMDLIHYAARRWGENGAPILLLLTVRQENFAAGAALRDWLTRLGRDIPLQRILIDTLSGTAVQQLVARLAMPDANNEVIQEFSAWLWAETKGLPFFIEALLQMLVGEGILAAKQAGDRTEYDFSTALSQVRSAGKVPVPSGVSEAILARMERLPQAATTLLLAAAVLGRECRFDTLCRVADLTEREALEAIETLLNDRFLSENSFARRPYTLAHDYIREVVYDAAHVAHRRVYHRRALIALEADRAPAAECAFHAVASLLDEPAFRFSLIAGDESLQANSFQESLAHYDTAREIAQRMAGEGGALIDSLSLQQLYQNRGRVLELSSRYDPAQANYDELAYLAEKRNNPGLTLGSLIARCIIHATHTPLFNPPQARELGQAALELARKLTDQVAEARALWCMMLVEFHAGGDSRKVFDYGEKSLTLARELGMKELMGYVLGNLSWAYLTQGQPEKGRKANAEAQAIWQALGNLPMLADTLTIKLALLRNTSEHEALLATAQEALRLSQSIGNTVHQSMALLMMGETHCLQGRLGQALAEVEAAMAISQASNDEFALQGAYSNLAVVYLMAGSLELAEQWADKLYAARDHFLPVFQMFYFANIARAKIALNKLEAAEALLEQAFKDYDQEGPYSFSLFPYVATEGHLQLARGNPKRTLARLGDVIQQLRQTGSQYYLAELLWLQGKAYLALDECEQAKGALLEAKAVAEDTGECTIFWKVLVSLSDLEMSCGNQLGAETLKAQAQEIINYIAKNAGSKVLRDSFLAQPAVERVLIGSHMSLSD